MKSIWYHGDHIAAACCLGNELDVKKNIMEQQHQHQQGYHHHQSTVIHTCSNENDTIVSSSSSAAATSSRSSPYPLIAVTQALTLVLEHCTASFHPSHPPISVPVSPSLATDGYVIAEDFYAAEPFPPFRASIMDGYAVYAADGPGIYQVVAQITAGKDGRTTSLKAGEVAYITTGSPVPDGADAVIMIERTEAVNEGEAQRVKILDQMEIGTNIRPIGCDVAQGQKVSHTQ